MRSNVIRLTDAANCRVNRAPARPPNANPTAHNIRSNIAVRRACRAASSGTCSANVVLPHTTLSQNNRRTLSRISTSRPAAAVSDKWRS
jgi:hypothetical protein